MNKAKEEITRLVLGNDFINKPSLRDLFTELLNKVEQEAKAEQSKLFGVVRQSEQCCLNPKHRTEITDMYEPYVICGNCGKEIV